MLFLNDFLIITLLYYFCYITLVSPCPHLALSPFVLLLLLILLLLLSLFYTLLYILPNWQGGAIFSCLCTLLGGSQRAEDTPEGCLREGRIGEA